MNRRIAVPLSLLALAGAALVAPPAVAAPPAPPSVAAVRDALPLGPAGLEESRTTRTVQPGVTLTRIVRGHTDPSAVWTVEVAIPSGPGSPDPDAPPAAISDEGGARATSDRLRAAGFDPRVERVRTPPLAGSARPRRRRRRTRSGRR